jgi:deoxyribose-phosphate aldolase
MSTAAATDRAPLPAPEAGTVPDVLSALGVAGTGTAQLRRFLHALPGVDPVGLEARSAVLATRSVKKHTKRALIDLAISMVDLTTLEGSDTPGKVRALCRKALAPDADDPGTPRVAAVCLYPDLVRIAAPEVAGTGVRVASVATAFPSGRSSTTVKLADTALAVAAGADEIDMVIDRGAFLAGDYETVFEQVTRVKAACGAARLKVILETGELATYDNVRRAAWLALLAGGDFVKTSTGKISPAATLPVTQVLLQAVRDFDAVTGLQRGVKPAGGIRTTKDALAHLVAVHEVAGPRWLDPHWFRFGASGVLNDLVMQRRTQRAGHYSGARYVSVD